MLPIEKNIPMPAACNAIYPFDQMEIGDSFFISIELSGVECLEKLAGRVSSAISARRDRNRDIKFARRVDRAKKGIRVWRVA